MADEFEIHEGENGVICKIFSPTYLKHPYNAEGGDYIKFENLSVKSCLSPRLKWLAW